MHRMYVKLLKKQFLLQLFNSQTRKIVAEDVKTTNKKKKIALMEKKLKFIGA